MINKLLEKHYRDGGFGVPTIEPNRTIKPDELSKLPIYAKWQLMPLRDRMGTLSSIQHTGILQITLFVDVAIGTDLIDQKAQTIVNHFGTEKSRLFHKYNDGSFIADNLVYFDKDQYHSKSDYLSKISTESYQLMIMSSTAMGAMPDGTGKFMMPITVEYRVT